MKRVKKVAIGIFLLSHALSGAAYAASVTVMGDTVDFTYDDTLLGLFGTPSVAGDTLFFTPVNFDATSLNGQGYAFTNETVNIRVTARMGSLFDSVHIMERGDYLLRGAGSTAEVTGQVRVFDIADPYYEETDTIMSEDPLNVTGVSVQNWEAHATVDVSAWNTANTLNVTLENLLLSSTTVPTSLGFVEKKYAALEVLTTSVATAVPEAQTYGMMLAGLGLVGFMVSRRRPRA